MTRNGRVKVLYIAGYSRSGSTILDSILGQIDGFFSTGELYYVWTRNILNNTVCGCGSPFRECEVWNDVFDGAFGGMDKVDARDMIRAQDSSTRTRHIPMATIPWGRRLLMSRSQQYLEHLEVLYEAIQARTGSRVIVDSSKVPLYGYLLNTIPSIDLYVVHLTRDPRAVSYSWLKKRPLPPLPGKDEPIYMDRYSVIKSSMVWNTTNAAVEMFWRRQPKKHLMLRYEDFVDRPQENLQRIVELVHEQDSSPLPSFVAQRTIELETNHTTSGNPSRFRTGTLELLPDREWISRMKPRDKVLATVLTFPLLLRYKYPVVRGPDT
jgi:Sulfotransferase domain